MINLDQPKIADLTYALNFKELDQRMRFAQGEAESSFGGLISGQSHQTNVPDTFDPNAPRIVFASSTKSIVISQLACQFQMNFNSFDKKIEDQWSIVEKNIKDFHSRALEFRNQDFYGQSSIIFQVNLRSESAASDLHRWIFERFLKVPCEADLASVGLQIGYLQDGLYQNISAGVYEKREAKFDRVPFPMPIRVNLDELPVSERGLVLGFDLNSRPRFQGNPAAVVLGPDDLITPAKAFSARQLKMIFTEGDFE